MRCLTLASFFQDLIRLSVGTEDVNDIINDLLRGLKAIPDQFIAP